MEKTNIHVLWAASQFGQLQQNNCRQLCGQTKSQNVKTSASKSEASQTEISNLSSETPTSLLLGTARLRQRRKWVGWVRCQGMHEGFENDPGNRQECLQKLVEKSAGCTYIMCSTVIPMEWHVVPSPCIRCVAKLSGCGAFYRLQQSLYQSKNLILSTTRELLSLSCEISDATNSDKQFAFRQCSLTTKPKYSCQMFLWQSKKNKISKFSYMEKSFYSKNVISPIFVTLLKLKK